MKEFLINLLHNIVDQPDKVNVAEETGEYGNVVLTISVAQEDMGKVIGKGGKVIRAIRELVKVLAVKNGVRVTVSLLEE